MEGPEGRSPPLLPGILADGDLEQVSILVDDLAVVALDGADFEKVPLAGLTLPVASSFTLPATLTLLRFVTSMIFHSKAVPPSGERVVEVGEFHPPVIRVELEMSDPTVISPAAQDEWHHPAQRFHRLLGELLACVGEVAFCQATPRRCPGSDQCVQRFCVERQLEIGLVLGGVGGRLAIKL